MIRSLSGSPLYADMISPESKFVGEALEMKDVRTIFVGAKEDERQRENRVTLLLGPSSSEKTELIDFLCNYFYGIDSNRAFRLHIANEKFNAQTPERPIQCYIFNNTTMPIRPIIIDTPGFGDELINYDVPELVNRWLLENWKMRIDSIGVVISNMNRISTREEDELQRVLTELPLHIQENISVFITASDGSRPFEPLLRRFGLSECPKYTIHTSCLFQKPMEDRLNDEHRKRYWTMSVNQFKGYYDGLKESAPVTISGLPYIDDALYGANYESGESSRSSVYSTGQSTVIEVATKTNKVLKPLPPPPPPKPKFTPIPPRPPPVPTSPIPPPIQIPKTNVDDRPGIPLSPEPIQTMTPPPPKFAPPKPPQKQNYDTANKTNTATTTTRALTNAMNEQLRNTRTSHYEISESSRQRNEHENVQMRQSPNRASYIESRRHSVPDDIRHYADESTPPPVIHDIADRYTTVAYMNHDPYVQTIRTHSPTRSNIAVRDAHRLSRENIQIIENTINSSTTDSQSEELRRMYSGRSANSVKPTGDVSTRYVYDTTHRSYTSQDQHVNPTNYVPNIERKRWSKSSEPRSETYFNDPYYKGSDVVTGYGVIETRNSRTSLHTITGGPPELVHSENKYDYQQITPGTHIARDNGRFSREDQNRRSRHQSEGSRQIHIERRISPERQRKDRLSGDYSHVNMHDNPRYTIPRDQAPPNVHRINGGEVYEDHQTYEEYTQINHQNRNGTNTRPQPPPYPQRYDHVPEDQHSNHYIIPKSMRGSASPIQVRVHLLNKSSECIVQHIPPHGHYDVNGQPIYDAHGAPFGVTEETTTTTTTTRKEEHERKRRKKEEDDRRRKREEDQRKNHGKTNVITDNNYDAYGNQNNGSQSYGQYEQGYGEYRDAEQGLLEEEYNTRHMKRTVEYPKKNKNPKNLEDYGRRIQYPNERYDDGHYQNRNNGNSRRHVQKTSNSTWGWSGWAPSNYSNPRDCFLNILCFIVAPIIIIAIIVVIIVFVIINSN